MIVKPVKYLKSIDCGNTVVYRHCPFDPPTEARIRRIDAEHYVATSTAELRRYAPRSETKGDNLESVRKSFNRLEVGHQRQRARKRVREVPHTHLRREHDRQQTHKPRHGLLLPRSSRPSMALWSTSTSRSARPAARVAHALRAVLRPRGPYMPNTEEDHPCATPGATVSSTSRGSRAT